jgi:hypothetical protein
VMHNTEQLSQDGLLKNTLKKPLTPKRNDRAKMVCGFFDYSIEYDIHIPHRKG